MATRQYIGARYVTKIYVNSLDPSSAEWEASVTYEPLTMVTYNDGSYLSRKEVPASVGNPADNPLYWAQTGFYNGQIASLQSQIDAINEELGNEDVNFNLKLHFLGRSTNISGYSSPQSMCAIDDDTFVVAYINYGTEAIKLRKYTIAGVLLLENDLAVTGHCNGMTFNGSNIVIANGSRIDIINPSTLTWVESVALTTITADNICYENDYYYVYYNGNVYALDSSFDVISSFEIPAIVGSVAQTQDSEIHDGVFYLVVNEPNKCIAVDVETHDLKPFMYFDELMDDYYPIGEMQSISFYDGDNFIINGKPRIYNPIEGGTYDDIPLGICAFGVGNLKNEIAIDYSRYNHHGYTEQLVNFEVNSNSNVFRPTGGSGAPYISLSEASMVAIAGGYMKPVLFSIINVENTDKLIVKGYDVQLYMNPAISIDTIVLYDTTSYLRGINFNKLNAYRSSVYMNNCDNLTDTASDVVITASKITGSSSFITNHKYNLSGYSNVMVSNEFDKFLLLEQALPVSNSGESFTLSEALSHFNYILVEAYSYHNRLAGSTICTASDLVACDNIYVKAYWSLSADDNYNALIQFTNETTGTLYSTLTVEAGEKIKIYGINRFA